MQRDRLYLTGMADACARPPGPEPWTWDWWATRATYLGAAGVVLAGLVVLSRAAERALPRRVRITA